MEGKAMNNQFKLAACLLLLTVFMRGVSVEACQAENEDCSSLSCCVGFKCEVDSSGASLCKPCQQEDEDCSTVSCYDGLLCVEVSSGVFQCEPETCEEHEGHSCEVNARECCDPLVCSCEQKCENCPLKLGDTCDGTQCCERRAACSTSTNNCECADTCNTDCDCCVGAVCDSNGNCVCKKNKGDSCDPNAAVNECCGLECVAVAVGVYECQAP